MNIMTAVFQSSATILLWVGLAATGHAQGFLLPLEIAKQIDQPPGLISPNALAFLNGRLFAATEWQILELNPKRGSLLNRLLMEGGVDALAGNEDTGLLYVSTGADPVIAIVSPDTGDVVGSLTVEPTNIKGLAINNGMLYAVDNSSHAVYEIDLATGQTLRQFTVSFLFDPASSGNFTGVEVFMDTVFVNVRNFAIGFQVHEFSLADFRHLGEGYFGDISGGSTFDGKFLWQTNLLQLRVTR